MNKEEADFVLGFAQSINMLLENTHLLKLNKNYYVILVCSSRGNSNNHPAQRHQYKGVTIEIRWGFMGTTMDNIIHWMRKLQKYAKNDTQIKMYDKYIEWFMTGDLQAHKESQKLWIKDIGPVIETNLGWVETYMDPQGVRATFEGFTAIVDKEQSKLCANLVDRGLEIIRTLPWPNEYEKDEFTRPDFTSLAIVSFMSDITPYGINIPNYDDIRQTLGFKNVAFDNVQGIPPKDKLYFMKDQWKDVYCEYFHEANFVMVSLHELLGHGSGKLLSEDAEGKLNFDKELMNPLFNEKVSSWYKPGDTWQTVFGNMGSSWEECRADSVALYLSCDNDICRILLPHRTDDEIHLIRNAIWGREIGEGFSRMIAYNVEKKRWGQAHSEGRYMFMRYLNGGGFVKIERMEKDGKPYFEWDMDFNGIVTEGKRLMGEVLLNLNVMKATADIKRGQEWWDKWTNVDGEWMELRKIVGDTVAMSKPWQTFAELELSVGDVVYKHPGEGHRGFLENRLKLLDWD